MEVLFLELESHLDLERPFGEYFKSIIRIQEYFPHSVRFFNSDLIDIHQQWGVDDCPYQVFIYATRDGRGNCCLDGLLLSPFSDDLLDFISIHLGILMFTLLEGFRLCEDKRIEHRVLRQSLAISFSIYTIKVHLSNVFIRFDILSKGRQCKRHSSSSGHF